MTQTGVITRLLDKGMAEVAVDRQTACGHCSGCGECVYGKRILVEAQNTIFAQPGERVVLEGETSVIMKMALLVYFLPVLTLFAGYLVGALLRFGQDMCIAASGVGLTLGAAAAVLLGNRHKKVDYRVVRYSR